MIVLWLMLTCLALGFFLGRIHMRLEKRRELLKQLRAAREKRKLKPAAL